MGIKTHKPTTPTMRFQITSDFTELTTRTPHKKLVSPMRKTGGPAGVAGSGRAATDSAAAFSGIASSTCVARLVPLITPSKNDSAKFRKKPGS